MPDSEVHVIQVFERRGGDLVPADREVSTPGRAERRARELARKAAGAVVICLSEAEQGARSATFLAAFGDVPEPYVECRVD
jgi:hypothetical protein